MTRSPQEVFEAHTEALDKADLALLLKDYRDDAVLVTVDGPIIGREAIGDFLKAALAALPQARFELSACVFAEDALLVRWSASSTAARIENAVDTFVFVDGLIRLQTTVFEVEPLGG